MNQWCMQDYSEFSNADSASLSVLNNGAAMILDTVLLVESRENEYVHYY